MFLTLTNTQWSVYSLYGLNLASDFSFANRMVKGAGVPELTFTCTSESPLPNDWEQVTPVYASPYHTDDGKSVVYLYRHGSCDVLRFTHVADFHLWPDRIVCHLLDATYDYVQEIYLLGYVFSFWLERRGIPALHASAVSVEGRAAAFLATNKGGKSTLAATLMQAGHPLLTDDILPLEHVGHVFKGRSGYPQMRMWPDQAQHFLGYYQELEQVHPKLSKRRVPVGPDGLGTFCTISQPLACLYLPKRHNGANDVEISISPVPSGEAIIELVRYSFVARAAEAAGLRTARFNFFTQLARKVPVRRIVYPSGLEHLPQVRTAILEDLAQL